MSMLPKTKTAWARFKAEWAANKEIKRFAKMAKTIDRLLAQADETEDRELISAVLAVVTASGRYLGRITDRHGFETPLEAALREVEKKAVPRGKATLSGNRVTTIITDEIGIKK